MKNIIRNAKSRRSAGISLRIIFGLVLALAFTFVAGTPHTAAADGLDTKSSGLLSTIAIWFAPENDTGVPDEAIADYDAQNKYDAEYLATTSCVVDGMNIKEWEMEKARLEGEIAKEEDLIKKYTQLGEYWKRKADGYTPKDPRTGRNLPRVPGWKDKMKAIARALGTNSPSYKKAQEIYGVLISAANRFKRLASERQGELDKLKRKLAAHELLKPEDCCSDEANNSV